RTRQVRGAGSQREARCVLRETARPPTAGSTPTSCSAFERPCRTFIECVRTRRQPLTNGEDACKTQELLGRILSAAGLPTDEASDMVWGSRSQGGGPPPCPPGARRRPILPPAASPSSGLRART